jgi:hypothetical protein
MKFLIMSRDKISKFTFPHRYAIIGIVGHGCEHPLIPEGYVDLLQLNFYDTDFYISDYPSIQKEDARKILEFVEKNKDKVDMFVVHCNAGISRSSGTVAALSFIYNGDAAWVFSDRRYIPNMLVYKTILDEAEKMKLIEH